MKVYCDLWMWQIDSHLVMASTVNFTGVLTEIHPWPQRVQGLFFFKEWLPPAAFVGFAELRFLRSTCVECGADGVLLSGIQGPEHVETMWQYVVTDGGSTIREGWAPACLARASFVIVASPYPQLLKMCVAYCKPQKEILILKNGWLTFFPGGSEVGSSNKGLLCPL